MVKILFQVQFRFLIFEIPSNTWLITVMILLILHTQNKNSGNSLVTPPTNFLYPRQKVLVLGMQQICFPEKNLLGLKTLLTASFLISTSQGTYIRWKLRRRWSSVELNCNLTRSEHLTGGIKPDKDMTIYFAHVLIA